MPTISLSANRNSFALRSSSLCLAMSTIRRHQICEREAAKSVPCWAWTKKRTFGISGNVCTDMLGSSEQTFKIYTQIITKISRV